MDHVPMCAWCQENEVGGCQESLEFCSNACYIAAMESFEEENDGQPSELTEWLDFDPDC